MNEYSLPIVLRTANANGLTIEQLTEMYFRDERELTRLPLCSSGTIAALREVIAARSTRILSSRFSLNMVPSEHLFRLRFEAIDEPSIEERAAMDIAPIGFQLMPTIELRIKPKTTDGQWVRAWLT